MDIDHSVDQVDPVVKNFLDHVADGRADQVSFFIKNKLVDLDSPYRRSTFNYQVSLGSYALGDAISNSRNKVFLELMKYIDIEDNTVPAESMDELGTALTAAAYQGNKNLVELLLNLGADVDGDKRFTPLHAAVEEAHVPIVQLLLENGANLEIRRKLDENHPTALELAAAMGNSQVVKILLDYSARFDVGIMSQELRNDNVRPAIVHAASSRTALEENSTNYSISLNAFEMLLKKGVDVNAADFDDITALEVGVLNNDIDLVRLLCDLRGSDISYMVLLEGLRFAIIQGNIKIIDILRQHDADINANFTIIRDGTSICYSPLVVAAGKNKTEVVKYLLNRGAAPQKESNFSDQGKTLFRQNKQLLKRHISATKEYLDKKIGPRDIHTVIFGMLYGSNISSDLGKRLQESRVKERGAARL